MIRQQKLTLEEALQKARHYCAYQERCHNEVKIKLYSFGFSTFNVNMALATLIEENYLNEERFAIAFAGGKFRMKQWGKTKIKYELQQKQVSSIIIKKALLQIDEDDYRKTADKLYKSYCKKLTGLTTFQKHLKTKVYLQQKGFEIDLINDLVKNSGR